MVSCKNCPKLRVSQEVDIVNVRSEQNKTTEKTELMIPVPTLPQALPDYIKIVAKSN